MPSCPECTKGHVFCIVAIIFSVATLILALSAFGSYGEVYVYSTDIQHLDSYGSMSRASMAFHILGCILTVLGLIVILGLACGKHYQKQLCPNKANLIVSFITELCWLTAAVLILSLVCELDDQFDVSIVYPGLLWAAFVLHSVSFGLCLTLFFCAIKSKETCVCCRKDEPITRSEWSQEKIDAPIQLQIAESKLSSQSRSFDQNGDASNISIGKNENMYNKVVNTRNHGSDSNSESSIVQSTAISLK